jgi:hypothetical protein
MTKAKRRRLALIRILAGWKIIRHEDCPPIEVETMDDLLTGAEKLVEELST